MNISAVDLFCGVGGVTHGFIQGGIPVSAGYDNDPSCQYAYEINNNTKFICADITDVTAEEITRHFCKDSIKVIVGCAPCQPYSSYSYRYKKVRSNEDPRYKLLRQFTRIITSIQPEIISMENVPDLKKREYVQYHDFIHTLKNSGYHIFEKIIKCEEYGIPQSRKRLVVLASKFGAIELMPPTHLQAPVTVRQAISHLEPICSGEQSANDPLHKSGKLTPLNLKRIEATPEGGGWKNWPKDLLLQCHKKSTGKTYTSVYGRMSWDKVAPTITTQSFILGTGRFGHPEQNRAISLREAALLQTFPQNYQFVQEGKPIISNIVARHIGNAVPVQLAKIIAETIILHIKDFLPS